MLQSIQYIHRLELRRTDTDGCLIFMRSAYPTKTKKKNALERLRATAMKLYVSGAISMKDADNISKIVNMRLKQL